MLNTPEIPLILMGCRHEVQIVARISQDQTALESFRSVLESLIDQHGVRFIGEEIKQSQSSIAEDIAKGRNLRYLNIDIPDGCGQRIKHRPHEEFNDTTEQFDDLLQTDIYAKAWSLVREYHMYQTALEGLRQSYEPSLLIVGKLHVEPLVALSFPGFKITSVDFDG